MTAGLLLLAAGWAFLLAALGFAVAWARCGARRRGWEAEARIRVDAFIAGTISAKEMQAPAGDVDARIANEYKAERYALVWVTCALIGGALSAGSTLVLR